MEQSLNPLDHPYFDVLELQSSYTSVYVKAKAQEFIVQLKGEHNSYKKILTEYCRLAAIAHLSPDPSDDDAARLDEILSQAETDGMLSFLIGEVDHLLGARMNLLTPEAICEYKLQQARLSEHLAVSPLDPDFQRMLQLRLREIGFYQGPIDGVLGERSREAVRKFQESNAVKADGIPGPKTVSILLQQTGIHADERT